MIHRLVPQVTLTAILCLSLLVTHAGLAAEQPTPSYGSATGRPGGGLAANHGVTSEGSNPPDSASQRPGEGPNLVGNGDFESGIQLWAVGSYHPDPNLNDAQWELTTDGCDSGQCLKMSHGRSTWQGAWQTVGQLQPGRTYLLRARFRTTASHYGHINLHDPVWRDAGCQVVTKSYSRYGQGQDRWIELVNVVRLPEADDCGPIADHAWRVYLYSYSPVEDPSPVYYDDVGLYETDDWPPGSLEEDHRLASTTCQRFSDGYPLVPCHSNAFSEASAGPAGGTVLVITGQRDKRESVDFTVPVTPNTLYRIEAHLRIEDRVVFNYLDLDYPAIWTEQRDGFRDLVDMTKGIWSGLYSVTVDGVSILPPIIKDAPYRSPSEVDWFHEAAFFQTGPSQGVSMVRIELAGFEGRLLVDGLTISPADSFIEDRQLHLTAGAGYQGMRIRRVSQIPLTVETNAARYRFADDVIECYHNGRLVARVQLPPNSLTDLRSVNEPGNVFASNDNIALSVGADSVVIARLRKPMRVSVSGPMPQYHAFEAGIVFATDYERGILFAPLRPALAVRGMPMQFDNATVTPAYSDSEFALRGLQFWRLVAGFNAAWQVDYEFAAGQGFLAQVFPPKEFDTTKYCAERMHTIAVDTVNQPEADYVYSLAKAGANINVGLVWMTNYAASENRLQPPEEYCRDQAGRLVHCASPEVARRDRLALRFDVTGPYRVAEPDAFRRLVSQAHEQGMRIIIYMSPEFYYTSDVDTFLSDLMSLVNDYDIDGVYYDGLYPGDLLRSLELVRRTRELLGHRFYAQHTSWETTLIRRSYRYRIPALDAQADLLWLGEGVKAVDDAIWRLNYCGRNVSNTVSGLLGELRPVDYSADVETSVGLTLDPAEQVRRSLACQGLFITNPYSEISYIHDNRFERRIAYESRLFREPHNRACLAVTCGNGHCDVGESILDCPADCAPPEPGLWLERREGSWLCPGDAVVQWLVGSEPLYALHYTFDGPLALDASGHKQHPAPEFGAGRRAPVPAEVGGRRAFLFDGASSLDGQGGPALDVGQGPLSILATLRTSSTARQALFSLEGREPLVFGLDAGRLTAWLPDGDKRYGVEEIVDEGCYLGRCVWAEHREATWQGIYQGVGPLEPGWTYVLRAMFRAWPGRRGFINLYDRSWKNQACQMVGRSFTAAQPGDGDWQAIEHEVVVPAVDDCGGSTADDEWTVYLYAHEPVSDPGPIWYDEVALHSVGDPASNRLANGGFEDGWQGWGHSSYVAPEVLTGSTELSDDLWHSAILSYDPPVVTLYADGRLEGRTEIRIRSPERFSRWAIGSRHAGRVAEGFVGLLDDVAVALRPLDDSLAGAYHYEGLRSLPVREAAACIHVRHGQLHRADPGFRLLLPACLNAVGGR